jgi:hypothetical protein
LAGRVIASHYAEPVSRRLRIPETLRSTPANDGAPVEDLGGDEAFEMLDDSLGWAWGYAGPERRVGYLPSEALAKD